MRKKREGRALQLYAFGASFLFHFISLSAYCRPETTASRLIFLMRP